MARWRNGEHGYGLVTKALHWLTVALLVAQVVVGLTMDADAADRAADTASATADDRADAWEQRAEERAEQDGEAAEERFETEAERRDEAADRDGDGGEDHAGVAPALLDGEGWSDGLRGLELHLLLGTLLLVVGLLRLLWRRTTPLPPWADHLGARERQLEGWLEKAMLGLLVVVPLTGLLLVLGDDDLVRVHVGAQLLLLAVVAVHVGLVLRHTVVRRHRHLSRMV